jgi:hypothetical protein
MGVIADGRHCGGKIGPDLALRMKDFGSASPVSSRASCSKVYALRFEMLLGSEVTPIELARSCNADCEKTKYSK